MDRKRDAFDKTLAGHVRKTMAGHKKVKKHSKHISVRMSLKKGGVILDELEVHELARESREEIHAMLNIGLETLFPDTGDQRQALVFEDTGAGTRLALEGLTYKCNVRIMDMDVDDIEDLVYILDLLDEQTGAWYWNKIEHPLRNAVALRLHVMSEEENDDG